MSRACVLPVDGDKLKELILDKGYITDASVGMGFGASTLSQAINRGKISKAMANMLYLAHGIKYEDYKPEEKEKPIPERPNLETEVTSRDEALLKTIISQLGSLSNSLTAIYQKLEEINGDQKKEIHP